MTWTTAELDALRRAYARGVTRVSYDGRTVEYASADDLLRRIREIERDMTASTVQRPVAGFASFGRGDR